MNSQRILVLFLGFREVCFVGIIALATDTLRCEDRRRSIGRIISNGSRLGSVEILLGGRLWEELLLGLLAIVEVVVGWWSQGLRLCVQKSWRLHHVPHRSGILIGCPARIFKATYSRLLAHGVRSQERSDWHHVRT